MSAATLNENRNIWIVARIVGLAALCVAAALWIFYMAIAPATESELESVDVVIVERRFNSHKGRVTSQDIRAVKSDGDEMRITVPYYVKDRQKVEIGRNTRVTLKISDHGNVYAIEGRRGTILAYKDGRDWYASRRIIPGIAATTMTLLSIVMALASWLGPILTEGRTKFAQR